MEKSKKTTEEILLEVLGPSYNQFDFQYDERFLRHAVDTIEDPTMAAEKDAGGASNTAVWFRSSLWFYGGGFEMASRATRDLFYALGRESELGWIREAE
jgi:hypothetical protein